MVIAITDWVRDVFCLVADWLSIQWAGSSWNITGTNTLTKHLYNFHPCYIIMLAPLK